VFGQRRVFGPTERAQTGQVFCPRFGLFLSGPCRCCGCPRARAVAAAEATCAAWAAAAALAALAAALVTALRPDGRLDTRPGAGNIRGVSDARGCITRGAKLRGAKLRGAKVGGGGARLEAGGVRPVIGGARLGVLPIPCGAGGTRVDFWLELFCAPRLAGVYLVQGSLVTCRTKYMSHPCTPPRLTLCWFWWFVFFLILFVL